MDVFDNSIVEQIELRMIRPSKFPVRYDAKNSAESANLKTSIREHGLLQPIVVRPLEHGFEIVAGHRRFHACKSLRWRFIPCKIREFSDKQAYEIQLTENLQRKSMDPLEEAEAYQKYVVDFGWGGVSDLAQKIGKSSNYITHRMQLLKLSSDIKEKIASRRLSVSQAIEVTALDPEAETGIVDEIIGNNLTIRQIRQIKSRISQDEYGYKKESRSKEASIIQKDTLALKVALSRIDDLIDDAHKLSPARRAELVEFLMNQRRTIHSMIDDAIHCKKKCPG
ncbi:MAG: ParB/RepB/Spo0J family partition protein [Nitrosopumilus sp. H8]|nr:MAG: ParB/RepB/Spo0J family partition protein [Nitrosopumilus sp. H8]RNJ78323.1 MAG: ParB/RepB/Spo0J family partition protein [Nitrosopumilus sp. H13]